MILRRLAPAPARRPALPVRGARSRRSAISVPTASRAPAAIADRRSPPGLGDPRKLRPASREWAAARTSYNAAVAKLFDQLRCGPDGWDTRAAALGTRIAPPGPHETDLAKLDAAVPRLPGQRHAASTTTRPPPASASPWSDGKKPPPSASKRANIPASQRTALQSHRHPRLRRLRHARLALRQTLAPRRPENRQHHPHPRRGLDRAQCLLLEDVRSG